MIFPERPTGNAWQLIGNSFNQGAGIVNDLGTQQNALQALVERRTQAALEQKRLEHEQAARDWELKQKQDDDAKKQAFIDSAIKLNAKGYQIPDTQATVPGPSVDMASPSGDVAMQKPSSIGGQAVRQYGNQPSMAQKQGPDQQITVPGGYRPATQQDKADLALQYGQITPKDYLEPSAYDHARDTMAGSIAGGAIDKIKAGQRRRVQTRVMGDRTYIVDLDNESQPIDIGPASLSSFSTVNKDKTSQNMIDFWTQQYADGKVDPATLSSMFSSRGGGKANLLGGIVQGAQSINPEVSVSQDLSDFNSSKNQKNKGTIATIDNVRSRMGRVAELTSSIDRTRFKTLNHYLQSAERGAGGLKANLAKLNQELMGEELNQVFGGGSAGSDAKLKLAQEISNVNDLPVDVALAKIEEINGALDARKKTFVNQMGRYGGRNTEENPQVGSSPPPTTQPVDPRKKMAQMALKDPQSTEAEKAQARKILGL